MAAPTPYTRNPYTLAFSRTQMKLTYVENGDAKVELFELHEARPEGVFHKTGSVQTDKGRVFEYGIIVTGKANPVRYVTWPA